MLHLQKLPKAIEIPYSDIEAGALSALADTEGQVLTKELLEQAVAKIEALPVFRSTPRPVFMEHSSWLLPELSVVAEPEESEEEKNKRLQLSSWLKKDIPIKDDRSIKMNIFAKMAMPVDHLNLVIGLDT